MNGNVRIIAGSTTRSATSAVNIAAAASRPKCIAGTVGVKHSISRPHVSNMDVDVNALAVMSCVFMRCLEKITRAPSNDLTDLFS